MSSAVGAITGGILGGAGGGSKPAGSTTTTTNSIQDLPDWLRPYVTGNLNSAQSVVKGLGNNGLTGLATPEIGATIRGDYLNSNPYLDQIYQHGANLIGQGVDSRFESAGRYGSGSHASSLAEPLAGLYGSLYGNNYQAERGRQSAAALAAPGFTQGTEAAALYPYQAFSSLIPNLRNTSGTETTPYFTNPTGNILGGALAGGELGSLFAGGAGAAGASGGLASLASAPWWAAAAI